MKVPKQLLCRKAVGPETCDARSVGSQRVSCARAEALMNTLV
jgi:hypothetical protein